MSTNAITTIDNFLKARATVMAETAPATMKVSTDRIRKIVVGAVANDRKLAECTPESIWLAVHKSIQLGLEPCSPLGHAYLVPFKNKGVMEATLIVGYKGLIALARNSGEIETVTVRTVREGDLFRVKYGLHDDIEHVPNLDMKGKPTHYYAIIRYKGGGSTWEVLTKEQVDAVRARSRASESGPWVTDFDAMAGKTAVKRAMRTAPLSVSLADAIATDDENEIDVTPARPAKQKESPALPPSVPVESFASEGAAQEFAAMQQSEEAPAPVVEAKVEAPVEKPFKRLTPATIPAEVDVIVSAIEESESVEDIDGVIEMIRTAAARTKNPMNKPTADTLTMKANNRKAEMGGKS
jgi:recombination protein RecT